MIIKNFKEFINESVRDLLTGKSDEVIKKLMDDIDDIDEYLVKYYEYGLSQKYLPTVKQFKKLSVSPLHRLEMCHNYELPDKYKPTDKEVEKYIKTLDNNERIKDILELHLDYELLPRDEDGVCEYDGNFYISEFEYVIGKLPDKFTVLGDLAINGMHLQKLPENLIVMGNLHCNNNHIKEIPNTLFVSGDMYCKDNTGYAYLPLKLPQGAMVGGNFINVTNYEQKE